MIVDDDNSGDIGDCSMENDDNISDQDSASEQDLDDKIYCYDSATGRYFPKGRLPSYYNDDMGMSLDLEIPSEEILITPEMLDRAHAVCEEVAAADIEMVAAVAEHESAWDEISVRAIRQALRGRGGCKRRNQAPNRGRRG
jgi:hypothetical protein